MNSCIDEQPIFLEITFLIRGTTGFKFAGRGIPALAHMAAALAFAISSNCALSKSVRRSGVLLLLFLLKGDLDLLRQSGDLRVLTSLLRYPLEADGRTTRSLDLDLGLGERDRFTPDFDRRGEPDLVLLLRFEREQDLE